VSFLYGQGSNPGVPVQKSHTHKVFIGRLGKSCLRFYKFLASG
jgi:hypothetical protein